GPVPAAHTLRRRRLHAAPPTRCGDAHHHLGRTHPAAGMDAYADADHHRHADAERHAHHHTDGHRAPDRDLDAHHHAHPQPDAHHHAHRPHPHADEHALGFPLHHAERP